MNSPSFLRVLFSSGIKAAAVIFNSLLLQLILSGPLFAAGPYTVSSSSQTAIKAGTYSGIIVNPGITPSLKIGAGTVILEGGGQEGLLSASGTSSITVSPTGAAGAALQLDSGSLSVSGMTIKSALRGGVYYQGRLLIGDPKNPDTSKTVTVTVTQGITGDSRPSALWTAPAPADGSVIETQGANLRVNGRINSHSIISQLNAYNGNIVFSGSGSSRYIAAGSINIKNGFSVSALNSGSHTDGVTTYAVNLENGAELHSDGDLNIQLMIGGAGGKMEGGSKITAGEHIFFGQGISSGSGLVSGNENIFGFYDGAIRGNVSAETALAPITQGGSESLSVVSRESAGGDTKGSVLLGTMSLDSVSAGQHILSGTYTSWSASLDNRASINIASAKAAFYPSSTITANSISAGARVLAGEINMPLNAPSGSLKAGNLYVIKVDNDNALEKSSGNLTIENGSLNLSSAANMQYYWQPAGGSRQQTALKAASQIDGDMTIHGNGDSSIKTLIVGGKSEVIGGTLSGNALQTGSLSFENLRSLSLTKTAPADLKYNLNVSGALSMTASEKDSGTRTVDTTNVGGAASVTGGSYTGATFHADSASFQNMGGVNFTQSLEADKNISIAMLPSGSSIVSAASAGEALSISGGEYSGASVKSADASLMNLKSLKISGSADISGDLTSTNSVSDFNSLNLDGSATVTGGAISAQAINTGLGADSEGNLTLSGASFNFGGTEEAPSVIKGSLAAAENSASSFDYLQTGPFSVSGGTLKGAALNASSADLSGLASLDMGSGKLETSGNASISSSASNVQSADIGGTAKITGGSYAGTSLKAQRADLSGLSSLSLDSISADDVSIGLASGGKGSAGEITAQESLSISGGAFSAGSVTSGGDAAISVPDSGSSVTVSGAAGIGGSLTATGNGTSSFTTLETGGGMTVTGGSLKAGGLTTGAKTGSGGDVTVTDASLDLGGPSVIHGGLSSSGSSSSHTFDNLTVDGAASMDGGYLVGSSLHAASGVFKSSSVAHIDSLFLDGGESSLEILDDSMVIVKSVKNPQGQDIVSGSGLIILGDPDDPANWSDVGDFVLQSDQDSGLLRADSAYVKAGNITGSGHGDLADDISAYRLDARSIDITDANMRLYGMNENASSVEGGLKISANGATRLGDINIGGAAEIQGGSVEARKFTSAGASFTGVELRLLGSGANASQINGDLNIADNKSASLGDIGVSGNLTASGGSVSAGHADIGGNLSADGVSLTLGGTSDTPGRVGGSASISMGKEQSSSLGNLIIQSSDLEISGGAASAERLEAGRDALIKGADITLSAAADNPGLVKRDLILRDDSKASLSNLTINRNLSASGGSLAADSLTVGNNASLSGTALSLGGAHDSKSWFKGDLSISGSQASSLGRTAVDGNLSASGGSLEALSLSVGKAASLTDTALTLHGGKDNPDTAASLAINNAESGKKARLGWMTTTGDLSASGGEFESTLLNIGGSASFSNVTAALDGVEGEPDQIAGDLVISDGSSVSAGHIQTGGASGIDGASLSAHELASASLDFNNASADIESLSASKSAVISSGSLKAGSMSAESASFKNKDGLIAGLKSMTLVGDSKSLNIGAATGSSGNLAVQIESLNLNGGRLNISNGGGGTALLALQAFSPSASGAALMNGNIAIGANGRLLHGTRDQSWLPAALADSRAILALAQPMRLGRGYGLHASGSGQPAPESDKIKFDAGSLFVIDGSNRKNYYTGEWIKTALLNEGNGAAGALSAEGPAAASVSPGAQIYIRNPQPNTVIVALGENITTDYTDLSGGSKARAADEGGWTGANLLYDKDGSKVQIRRLDGDYAGQFSVLPADDSPSEPSQPSNPATPGNPSQPGAQPSNPSEPSQPSQPGDQPSNPAAPDTPNNHSPAKPAKPSDSHPNADPGIHDVIENESGKGNIGGEPGHLVTNNGSGFLSYTLTHENPHDAARLVEGSSRIVVLGAVPQLALTANKAGQAAMNERLSLSSIRFREDGAWARSVSLWAVPLYKASTAWSLEAGNMDYDYHGAIGGAAMGGDISFEDISRFGLAVNFGGGYSKSGGDLPQATNNMSFWGAGAYGGWYPGNLAVTADLSFTSTYNELKQDISILRDWNELKADVRACVVGAALNFEYLFKTDFLDIIPHAGAKYHYLHVYDYDVSHSGGAIIEGKSFDQNIWTFPFGVSLVKEISLDNGCLLKPSLDFRVTPAAGDIKAKTKTRFTNTGGEIELETKTMDYFNWGASAGLEASFGNFTMGVRGSIDAGEQSQSLGVFGTLRYEF